MKYGYKDRNKFVMSLRILIFFLLLLAMTACQPLQPAYPDPVAAPPLDQQPVTSLTLELSGFTQRIHDPVMAKEGDTYYVFSTGSRIIVICSEDMLEWRWCGRIFDRNPQWIKKAVPGVMDLWAPDISYFNGKWHLYYAGSTFGSNHSVIGLATNRTLDAESRDYHWLDEGEVIASQPHNNWNAIDANLTFDRAGQPWLAFGSYWSGIKLRKIDLGTGKLDPGDETLYALADRSTNTSAVNTSAVNTGAVEAPFIIERGGNYYLFVSFDSCCRGAASTYNVRVGRAEDITGPYIDQAGIPLLDGGGTQILDAYDRWRGPGHNGIYIEGATTEAGMTGEGQTYWIVYHAYDAKEVGIPKLRIEALGWDDKGWPYLASQE